MSTPAGRPNIKNLVLNKDGTFNKEWYLFFEQIWKRSGGPEDGLSDLEEVVVDDISDLQDEVDVLQDEVDALEQSVSLVESAPVTEQVEEDEVLPAIIVSQPYDDTLSTIAELEPTTDEIIYFTGDDVADVTTLTAFGRSLINDANAGTARATLGLVIGTDVQAWDAGLQSISGLTTLADRMIYTTASDVYAVTTLSAYGRALIDDANAGAARTTLGLVIGTDVQAWSAVLDATTASFLIADETKLDFISVTQAADLDTMESDIATNNAKVSNVTTNLSYTASTRTVASSDGTDAVLTEVVAAGNSGLMTGTDKTKLDGLGGSVDLTSDVTGILPLVNGGTGDAAVTSANIGHLKSTNQDLGTGASTVFNNVLVGSSSTISLVNNGTCASVKNSNNIRTSFTIDNPTGEVGTIGSNASRFRLNAPIGKLQLLTGGILALDVAFGSPTITYAGRQIINDTTDSTSPTSNAAVKSAGGLSIALRANFGSEITVDGTTAKITSNTGSPEGVLTAPIGSRYARTDGGAGTSQYKKESGTGNTGWVAY